MEENYFEVIHENILQKLEEIIEIIEEKEFSSYFYDGKKFMFIDDIRKINFLVGIHKSGFCIKDKIAGIDYSVNKKSLDENTTVQEIIIQDCTGKRYYCFLERESFTKLIECIKNEYGINVFCRNNEIYGLDVDEVIEYADEVFDMDIEDPDDIDNQLIVAELDEIDEEELDKLQKLDNGFCEGEDVSEDGYDDEYRNNYKEEPDETLDEDSVSIETATDENCRISQYLEMYNLGSMEEHFKRSLTEEDKEYMKCLEQCYKNYLLKFDNQKIEGIKKTEIISEYEMEAESNFYISSFFREGIKELKAILDERIKDTMERE